MQLLTEALKQSSKVVVLTIILFSFRIAELVEQMHSESAKSLRLLSGETSKNESFIANTLAFTELKVGR